MSILSQILNPLPCPSLSSLIHSTLNTSPCLSSVIYCKLLPYPCLLSGAVQSFPLSVRPAALFSPSLISPLSVSAHCRCPVHSMFLPSRCLSSGFVQSTLCSSPLAVCPVVQCPVQSMFSPLYVHPLSLSVQWRSDRGWRDVCGCLCDTHWTEGDELAALQPGYEGPCGAGQGSSAQCAGGHA